MKSARKILQIIFQLEAIVFLTIIFICILPFGKLMYLLFSNKTKSQSMWYDWKNPNDQLSQVQKQY